MIWLVMIVFLVVPSVILYALMDLYSRTTELDVVLTDLGTTVEELETLVTELLDWKLRNTGDGK